MLKKIIGLFKKKPQAAESANDIQLSKLDKHLNFFMREALSNDNKAINEAIDFVSAKKTKVLAELHAFHKKPLMNPNIPEREKQIMEGNRDAYIKRLSRFVSNIDLPRNAIPLYSYVVKFSEDLEAVGKELQRAMFILNQFFANEVKEINQELKDIERIIIDIRIVLERNNIKDMEEIMQDMKKIHDLRNKIRDIRGKIGDELKEIQGHDEKIAKLNERILTITSGTDYKALEAFRKEKEDAEKEYADATKAFEDLFSDIETALKKYYYKNQDKKIIRTYLENKTEALMHDEQLELAPVLVEVAAIVEQDGLDLKDKKKETTIATLRILTYESLKEKQATLKKLLDAKQRAQAKITHNSASLNLSEQQYWLKNTQDKIAQHQQQIEKYNKDIERMEREDEMIRADIKEHIQTIKGTPVVLVDDLTEEFYNHSVEELEE